MNINRTTLSKFRVEFAEAVKELEEKHGIKIQLGNITFESDNFRTKMSVSNKTNQKAKSAAVKKTPEELVGESIVLRGTKFQVKEYKANRPKYPFVIQNTRGTRYKTSYKQVIENIL